MPCQTLGCKNGKILGLFESYDCPECHRLIAESPAAKLGKTFRGQTELMEKMFAPELGRTYDPDALPRQVEARQRYNDLAALLHADEVIITGDFVGSLRSMGPWRLTGFSSIIPVHRYTGTTACLLIHGSMLSYGELNQILNGRPR